MRTAQILDQVKSPQIPGGNPAPVVSIIPVVRQDPQGYVTPTQLVTQNQEELSAAVQKNLAASVYSGSMSDETLCEVSPHSFLPHTYTPRSSPPHYPKVQCQEAPMNKFG